MRTPSLPGRPFFDGDGERNVECHYPGAPIRRGADGFGKFGLPEKQRLGNPVERFLIDDDQHHVRGLAVPAQEKLQIPGLEVDGLKEPRMIEQGAG